MAKTPVGQKRQKRAPRRGGSRLWAITQVGTACAVLGAALLGVLPAQSYRLFEARLVASEGSAWVVLAGLLLLPTVRPGRRGAWVAGLAVVSMATAAVPIARAYATASALGADITRAFGPLGDRPPVPLGRRAPLVVTDLAGGVGLPDMQPREMVYAKVDGEELVMDVYIPPDRRRAAGLPGVLVIHGGGWRGGTRREFSGLSRYLAARGYVVASMDYRLAPRWPYPAARDDVAAAVSMLEARAAEIGLDARRLVLLGRSAGAQLALLHAYAAGDPAIKGVVSFYGPTDLVYGYEHPADPKVFDSTSALAAYLGGHLNDHLDTYRAASPIRHADAQAPPTLLIHGVPDELVDVEQSRRLDRRLAEAGAPHLLVELPWASHGCDYFLRGPCGQISTFVVEQFLARTLGEGKR